MEKCGVCGAEVPKQPCITKDGTCDTCHHKLELKEEKKK
jgi:DNA-directed RNA polymerase subunit RPC12/RpoP